MLRSLILAGAAILALSGAASAADHPCYENHWLQTLGFHVVGTVCGNGNVDNNGAPGIGFTSHPGPANDPPHECRHEHQS